MASSLELNKLVAGLLTAGIIAVGAGVLSGLLYHPRPLQQHAFPIDVGETEAAVAEAAPAEETSIAVLLASADPAAGQTITRQCAACHVFNEGGDNRVGPYLWNVVGRDIASVAGFNYSAALQGMEGVWTFEALDGFLANPRGWAPGTSMSYAGLRNAQDRANLIAYMREQSNDPVPLPDAEAAAAPAEAAPAAAEVAAVEAPVTEAPAAAEVAAAEAVDEAPVAAAEAAVAEDVAAAAPAVEEEVAAAETAVEEPVAVVEEPVAAAEEVVEEPVAAAEAVVEEPAAAAEAAAEATTNGAEASAMVAMVAAADPAAGERSFRQCAACHTVDRGGQNRVGPNLWGVFGADVGHHEGFNYSNALLSIAGIWTVDKLDAYLADPRGFAPGNRMAFAGLRNEADRAAMIAYLRTLSDDPKPVDIQ